MFSWTSYTGIKPYYAIYDVQTQIFTTSPTLIDDNYSHGVKINVFPCYNNQNNQVVFSWADRSNPANPYYAIYTQPIPPRVSADRLLKESKHSSSQFQKGVTLRTIPNNN
ncbi:MAG: hypothetical protein WCG10_01270 [Chlamydiota bacterium]